jgi:hypothetical protein
MGSGAETVLAELADAAMPDEAWLRAVETFGELHRKDEPKEGRRVVAILQITYAT